MTKPYSLAFKENVVKEYRKFLAEGTLSVKEIEVNTINDLIGVFGITKYSLYSWAEKFDIEDGDQNHGENNEVDLDFENELPGEKKDDVIDEDTFSFEVLKEIEPSMTIKMGTTYFQSLAQGLGIKNYRMPLKQLYLTIGNELVRISGLVENNLKVRKELRIE